MESLWGASEFHTRAHNLRYLLLFPEHYNPSRRYELWVNLHGSPGCASHAVFQYSRAAKQRDVFLLAPEATEGAGEYYTGVGAGKTEYHLWDMKQDPDHVLEIIDEVLNTCHIDRSRVGLLGFSAGCEMGWRLLAKRPAQFCFFGGVANRFKNGKTPPYATGLRRAAKTVPIFYGVGQEDAHAGPDYAVTLKILKSYGFRIQTVHPPKVGHDLPDLIKSPLLAYFDEVRSRLPRESRAGPSSTVTKTSLRATNRFTWIPMMLAVGLAGLLTRLVFQRKCKAK